MKTRLVLVLAALAAAVAADAVEVIDPSEVAPGSAGTCITEMDGGQRVEIPLTVLGTVGPWTPEGEIVLVRLDDDRFRDTGIIAGMSGSPVYVDGRLLGALAFGWSFSKEPIGGVTPFARMESLAAAGTTPPGGVPGRPDLAALLDAGLEGGLGEVLADWLLPEPSGELHRLPIAVTSSAGWGTAGNGWLGDSWRRLGWVSVPGGSGSSTGGAGLEPGSMVAGVMVDGDAVLAAGGTVTEVRGDQVWAFGHPFLGGGGFRLPMARAEVVAVLPSLASSFKFFSVGATVGSFVNDRSRGIWGRLGESAPMVPVRVTVDRRRFDFRCVRHPNLTPFLVAYLAQSSQAANGRLFGDQTVELRVEMRYAGQEPAVYRQIVSSADAPAQTAATAAALVAYLENTVFELPGLEAIELDLETAERLTGAELVDAVPRHRVVRPGQTLPVRLRLRPYRGDEFVRDVEIRVPQGLPEGQLDLVVADGASWTVYDLGMRPFLPGSFGDEIRLVDSLLPATDLVLALERRETGVALEGGSVAMPPGLVVQLGAGLGPELTATSYAVAAKVVEPMEIPVAGAQRIELQVRSEERMDRSEVP